MPRISTSKNRSDTLAGGMRRSSTTSATASRKSCSSPDLRIVFSFRQSQRNSLTLRSPAARPRRGINADRDLAGFVRAELPCGARLVYRIRRILDVYAINRHGVDVHGTA